MIELTLLTLLNYVGDNFCEYRNIGHDNYKSLLLSYSDASNKFGALEVKRVNVLLVLLNNAFRPYLKSTKKGLTYVGPGDGEPYF